MKLRQRKILRKIIFQKTTRAAITVSGLSILAALLILLAGCGRAQEEGGKGVIREDDRTAEMPGTHIGGDAPVVLKLAAFGSNSELAGAVDAFNLSRVDYQITVEQYARSEVSEEDGIARLQREIMSGKGPDLIDFGAEYATSDIVGGYTEDLSPYLERERERNGGDFFDNILDLFRYNGKMYVMPVSFTMETFAGSRAVLGEREGWNIRELMDCYENRKEGAILYPGEMKKDVFGTLMHGNLDYYVDWERGDCRFDGEEFSQTLSFADQFPDTLRIADDYSAKQIFLDGGALLYPIRLRGIYDICQAEYIFGDDVCYIGFPVEQGSGTVVAPSALMLAISARSEHKEAAWEFLAGFLSAEYQEQIRQGFPIRRGALEKWLAANREAEYVEDAEGESMPVAKERLRFEGEEPVEIYHVSEAQAERLLRLIETADLCSAGDYQLYRILLEEAEVYFDGDKSLEETCRVIQSRAAVYVSERVK